MRSERPPLTSIMTLPEITALSRHIDETAPSNRSEHGHNVSRLRELSAFVREKSDHEVAACLEAAASLIEAIAGPSERLDRTSIHEIACRLLGTVEQALAHLVVPPAGEAARSPETDVQHGSPQAPKGSEAVEPAPAADQEPSAYEPKGDPALPEINNMVFGELMIELGWSTREQVARALDMHKQVGIPVGECLLVQGSAAAEQILEALKIQERMRSMSETAEKPTPFAGSAASAPQAPGLAPDDASILVTKQIFFGEVLLGMGMITKDQLERAMRKHHFENVRVGQALVELGALTEEDLKRGLDIQKSLLFAAGLPVDQASQPRHSRRR
jgi:hypothetical protein